MDRNTIVATILIALTMFVWLWYFTPPDEGQYQPGGTEDPITDTTEVAAARDLAHPLQEDDLPADITEEELAPAPADGVLGPAARGEAREVVVQTPLYTATFNTQGATPTSYELREYLTFTQDAHVELIDSTTAGALALVFTTPQNRVVDSRQLYFDTEQVTGDTLRIAEEPMALTFTAQMAEGTLRQTYTFHPDDYEVELAVEQEGAETFTTLDGYELVWNGGLPFTEGNPENEAQRSGSYARSGGEVEYIALDGEEYEEQSLRGQVDWVAVKNKYFTSVMLPQGETRGAELIGEQVGVDGIGVWEDYQASLLLPRPAAGQVDEFKLFMGPMDVWRLDRYDADLYDMVDFGWDFFEIVTRPLAKFVFIPTFNLFDSFLPNYGLVIILFAFCLKMVLYPLTKSSYKSMAKMRELQPAMQEIKDQYGDDPQKQQEAMMKMYREKGVNPLGGCMPMLLQYPIIIALWQFLPQSINIRQQSFLWANDLSAPDVILSLPFTIPVYGDFVAGFTLLMGLSMIAQMHLTMSSSGGAQQKVIMYVMPIFLFAIFNGLAAGLSLYYLCYNVITAIQQKLINTQTHEEAEAEKASGSGKKGRSLSKNGQSKRRKRSKVKS